MKTGFAVQTQLDFEIIQCCNCGIDMVMAADYVERRRKDGETFYCLNGHPQSFRQTETDRLKEQLAKEAKTRELLETRLKDANDRADANYRSLVAQKGQVTKLKKRVQHGVCPCCNRTFANLGRHMQGQHPEFSAED